MKIRASIGSAFTVRTRNMKKMLILPALYEYVILCIASFLFMGEISILHWEKIDFIGMGKIEISTSLVEGIIFLI